MTNDDSEIRSWTVHRTRTVYDGRPFVRVDLADVTAPDGSRFDYHVVRLPRVAIALVVDEDVGAVLLLWRERWVVGKWGYELFGGLVEDGEAPAATAEREALEESGWRPRGPAEHLLALDPLPGIADATMDIYLWRHGADRVGEPSDAQEVVRGVRLLALAFVVLVGWSIGTALAAPGSDSVSARLAEKAATTA
ncbi:MAG TPA: NUDIX domain-containing protein [Pseudonocardiaceae bacterium]|nr:NUDIX domain-containing protein [Pseudonocardiaceae bacterium]